MAGAEPGHGLPAAGLPLEADDFPGRPAPVQPHVPPGSRLHLTELRPDARSGRRRDPECVPPFARLIASSMNTRTLGAGDRCRRVECGRAGHDAEQGICPVAANARSARQDLASHGEGILPPCPCSQENGQKLLRRQRARANGPETLTRTVVFEVLGKTQRHAPRVGRSTAATYPFLRDGALTAP